MGNILWNVSFIPFCLSFSFFFPLLSPYLFPLFSFPSFPLYLNKLICLYFFQSQRTLSTKEQLEEIQNEMDAIETFKLRATVQEKNSIFFFYVISVLSYITGLFYIYYEYSHNISIRFKLLSLLFILIFPVG